MGICLGPMARVELVKPRTTRQCSFFLLTGVGVEGKDSKNTFGVGEKDGLERVHHRSGQANSRLKAYMGVLRGYLDLTNGEEKKRLVLSDLCCYTACSP